ncbi:MAG: outer membrane protein insertion porin family [Halanaerobiales bacterium]|nr:outer membrane protein insertion porin family [Halanaerobiales bacterium]
MKRLIVLTTIMILLLLSWSNVLAEDSQVITGISLEGNNIISDQEILSVIKTKAGDILDEKQLKADMEAIYDLGYFQDVKVSFEVYQGGLKAIFELVEYPVVKEIVFKGNQAYEQATLFKMTEVEAGKILNHQKLVNTRKKIEQKYHDDGYILARFTDINISPEGVLTFEINEGYLNKIILKGNEKTKDFVILRELNLKEDQVLNIKEIQKGIQKLVRLNFFENIEPELERVDNESNKVDLVIKVTEAKTGNLGAGVTWSSKDGWLGFVNVKERNLLGNGQSLGFSWEFGGVTNYSLNFHEPWLSGTPTSFGISLYDKTADGSDALKGEYEEHRQGGSISLGHKVIKEWYGKVRFKLENSEIDWKNNTYTEDGKEYKLIDESNSVRSLTLQVSRDTTNHPFNPTEGVIDIFSIEYAGQVLGGDANFTKYNADLRRYYPGFKPNHAWALRLNTGIGDGDMPELEKYRLGGSETLRGYDHGTFSGNDMLLLSAEYRFPIAENFTGVIFADGGNTWDSLDDIDFSEIHYSLGAGLRMNTPIGMIRLDYGFNEDGDGQPHFSIGQTF